MDDMQAQIQRIEQKLQQVLKEYYATKKELLRLQKENVRLTGLLQQQAEQADHLHQKVDALKFNTTGLEENTKKELEKRINIYLKDIDRCLALLHN
jgi:ABC-type transporter Mla subunit MlaD